REKRDDAKAWWQLNFAYHKVGRDTDSLMAVRKAHQLDPADTFASSVQKFEEINKAREAESTPPATVPRRIPAAPPPNPARAMQWRGGSITQQLLYSDVYAEPGINVDVPGLQRTADELRPTVVKFAIFNSNANSRQLSREADRIREYLRDYMNRGQGYVIVG